MPNSHRKQRKRDRTPPPPDLTQLSVTLDAILNRVTALERSVSEPRSNVENQPCSTITGTNSPSMPEPQGAAMRVASPLGISTSVPTPPALSLSPSPSTSAAGDVTERLIDALRSINPIDAATGQQESRRSALSRAVRLAQSLRRFGLRPGDVLVLGGRNHLDVHIPFYAALLNGLPMAGVDPQFKYKEIVQLFKIVEPKIAFCELDMYDHYQRAVLDLGLATKIVTFGAGETSLTSFMDTYEDSEPEEQFNVAQFDVSKVYCWLVSTSGSTGFPKVAALSHSSVLHNMSFFRNPAINNVAQQQERRCSLNMSSIQWMSACYSVLAMTIHNIKLQSSAPCTTDHVIDIINKYKPVTTVTTPMLLASILHHEKHCDLTCFEDLKIGGSNVHLKFIHALRARVRKDTKIVVSYGITEIGGAVLVPCPDGPLGNVGRPLPCNDVKLVDPDTGRTILEPHVTGELWLRGSRMECYYNNPKATAEAFSEDGFLKTGDLLYRDENNYYFFVERLKMLLKYRNYQVIPPEVEEVILSLPGVEQACVVGVPHPDDGERAVAAVQRQARAAVTAQQVKEHVASHLSVPKHLHGGVVFFEELPQTSTGKIARNKVKEMVLQAERE